VLICTLAYVFAYIDRQILSLLIQPIKHDLMLTDCARATQASPTVPPGTSTAACSCGNGC
jgi:hypothetical protein